VEKKKARNFIPQKINSSMENLVRNEENENPVPDPNRVMINVTNEHNDVHKELLKVEIENEVIEILMEKLQVKVKENIENQLRDYQDNTNKNCEDTETTK
jgi:hypothetical protein